MDRPTRTALAHWIAERVELSYDEEHRALDFCGICGHVHDDGNEDGTYCDGDEQHDAHDYVSTHQADDDAFADDLKDRWEQSDDEAGELLRSIFAQESGDDGVAGPTSGLGVAGPTSGLGFEE